MILLRAAGLLNPESIDEQVTASPKAFAMLVEQARLMLLSGVSIRAGEWAALLPCERLALVRAGQILRSEAAAATGLAAQGPRQAAEVLRPCDGGEMAESLTLEKALGQVALRALSEVHREPVSDAPADPKAPARANVG